MKFTLILLSVLLIAAAQGQTCTKDADCTTSGYCCLVTSTTYAGASASSHACYQKSLIKTVYDAAKSASTTTSVAGYSYTFSCVDGSEKYTIGGNASLISFTFAAMMMMIFSLYL